MPENILHLPIHIVVGFWSNQKVEYEKFKMNWPLNHDMAWEFFEASFSPPSLNLVVKDIEPCPGRGVSEKVSAVGFCLGSGWFGICNSD